MTSVAMQLAIGAVGGVSDVLEYVMHAVDV